MNRAAHATIRGYYYQFDTTILKLLALPNDDDHIVVEGIEDIDINTLTEKNTIQCKYLSKPKFINSAVREPIILMLDHFISPSTSNDLKYSLYVHFEHEAPGISNLIDVARLKSILTYKENSEIKYYYDEKGISDIQLSAFLNNFRFEFGEEFYAQQKKVMQRLKAVFKCSDFEADTHFYNNALRVIIDTAIKGDINLRTIKRKSFLNNIDLRKKLFSSWYIKLRSKDEYLTSVKKNLQTVKALDQSKYKFLIIGNDLLSSDNDELPCISFIESLLMKYYNMTTTLRNSKPITVIFDCDNNTLLDIKKKIIVNNLAFNDGYENIEFNTNFFNEDPVTNRNKTNTKIIKSSYLFRIISLQTLVANMHSLNTPKVVLHFSNNDCPYPHSESYQWFDIKYCENLKDISKIIL